MINAQFLDHYDRLLALLYDGVRDYGRWQEFVDLFNELCEARDTSIIVISPTFRHSFYVLSSDRDPGITDDYIERSLQSAAFFNEIPAPVPTTINEMMSEQRFLDSQLYREFFSQIDVRYLLCQDVTRSRQVSVRITSKRSAAQGQFGATQKALFARVVPHLRRAMDMRDEHYHNGFMRTFFESTIDKMDVGYFMLDRHGRILLANSVAEKLIREQVGFGNHDGYLRLADNASGPDMRALVEQMVEARLKGGRGERSQGFRIDTRYGDPVLSVVMKSVFDIQQIEYGAAILVYVTDCRLDDMRIEAATFREIYGFTRSESRLAVLLTRGESLSEAADHLHVSINTVRTHLRGIYEKLGTNKQYKVTALLNNSAARLM